VTVAAAGLPAALLAGMTAVPPHVFAFGAGPLSVGLAAVTLYGGLTAVAVAHRVAWFLTVTVAAAFGAIGAAVVVLTSASAAGVAAVLPVPAAASGAVAPMISLRLARLPLPTVPADMDASAPRRSRRWTSRCSTRRPRPRGCSPRCSARSGWSCSARSSC
jgi:hypothetical protein